MKSLQTYFQAFDGTATWSQIQPLFESVMHQDLTVVTADGECNRDQWVAAVQGMLAKGAKTSGFEITSRGETFIDYRLVIDMGTDRVEPSSRAHLREGKIVRVEPVVPEVYSEMAKN